MKTIAAFVLALLYCQLTYSQDAKTIEVRRVIVKLDEGQPLSEMGEMRTTTILYGKEFRYNSSFTEEELIESIKKLLNAKGLKVLGYGNAFKELKTEAVPDLALVFIIKNFKFDYSTNLHSRYVKFESNMEVDIQALNLHSNVLVFDKSIQHIFKDDEHEGFSLNSKNFTNFINSALDDLLSQLLALDEFKGLLDDKMPEGVALTDSSIKIHVSAAKSTLQLKECMESTVTLKRGSSHGSGAIVSADGLILTCNHNIYANTSVEVVFSNGIAMQAEVLRKNPEMDVALLKLTGIKSKPIPISMNATNEPGTEVWAIGTPGFTELSNTVSKGIVSGNRVIEEKQYIQTDASVSPGNSGGPLLDKDGKIIGLVNAKVIAQGMEGIGFAIPIAVALEALGVEVIEQ